MTTDIATAVSALKTFKAALCDRFVEREREISGLLLALVAGEHVLMLGPPGTAKSALALALSEALGWRSFVRLMGAQTLPEELFGPYDLSGLTESPSRFERVTTGYLPEAQIAFLDEIFKANSAILNSLLTALNERRFDNGTKRLSLPLQLAVGASNEYPQDDSLAALYDRFMLRFWVSSIRSDDAFVDMLLSEEGGALQLDAAHVERLQAAVDTVTVSRSIGLVLAEIRQALAKEHGITASDRRWRKSVRILKASALLAGRSAVKTQDLGILSDVLWTKHEERDVISAVIMSKRSPKLAKLAALSARAEELFKGLPSPSTVKASDLTSLASAMQELSRLTAEAEQIVRSESDEESEFRAEADRVVGFGEQVKALVMRATMGNG